MIDIGASTFDISTFLLDEEKNDMLTSEVKFLGVHILRLKCINFIKNVLMPSKDIRKKKSINSSLKKFENVINSSFDIDSLLESNELAEINEKIEKPFFKECRRIIYEVLRRTKKRRDPNSKHLRFRLPTFLCGGGSKIIDYKNLITKFKEEDYGVANLEFGAFDFDIIELKKPTALEAKDLNNEDYHRLAVAYGLSFLLLNIGEITPPDSIEDVTNELRKEEKNYISKDMV